MRNLTPKAKRFISEYLVDSNATQAAIRAGYSPRSAHVTGCRLLKHPKVATVFARARAKVEKETTLDAAWVIVELKKNHYTALDNGNVGDSTRALELIGKHFGAFVDKLIVDGELTINVSTGIPGEPGSEA